MRTVYVGYFSVARVYSAVVFYACVGLILSILAFLNALFDAMNDHKRKIKSALCAFYLVISIVLVAAIITAFTNASDYIKEWQVYVEDENVMRNAYPEVFTKWHIKEMNGNFITFVPNDKCTKEDYIQWEVKRSFF